MFARPKDHAVAPPCDRNLGDPFCEPHLNDGLQISQFVAELGAPTANTLLLTYQLRVPTKPAMHSNLKPAGYSDRKPATLGVNRMGRFDDVVEG